MVTRWTFFVKHISLCFSVSVYLQKDWYLWRIPQFRLRDSSQRTNRRLLLLLRRNQAPPRQPGQSHPVAVFIYGKFPFRSKYPSSILTICHPEVWGKIRNRQPRLYIYGRWLRTQEQSVISTDKIEFILPGLNNQTTAAVRNKMFRSCLFGHMLPIFTVITAFLSRTRLARKSVKIHQHRLG